MSQTVSGLRLAVLGNHTARWLSCWRTTAETSHTDREEEVNKGLEETDSGQMPIQQRRHAKETLPVNVNCQGSEASPSIAAAKELCGTEPL
ncbi:hypothetical protein D4764_10G0005130 [Takifugu flavidus]|uniref:Uncharacterized protein n=1 Tax=Takifugu flavidus TaxID=433684 RepID=A0A5C6PJ57_9TELE|nr:hypothetical protein D4764_10G0005130 [Takifugu flavidus]